jgi:hypothetical protein
LDKMLALEGLYTYILVVNGVQQDIKKMVVIK